MRKKAVRKNRARQVQPKRRAARREDLPIYESPKGVLSWVSLTETEIYQGEDTGRLSVKLALDPEDDGVEEFISALQDAQEDARATMVAEYGPKVRSYELSNPVRPQLRKGPSGRLEETGLVTVKFRSKFPPEVRNYGGKRLEVDDVVPNSEAIIEFTMSPFAMAQKRLVGASLRLSGIEIVRSARRDSPPQSATRRPTGGMARFSKGKTLSTERGYHA